MVLEKINISALENVQILSENEAARAIEALRSMIMQMGANDSENNRIDDIINQMRSGEITPLEAVDMVESIRNSKQDYH